MSLIHDHQVFDRRQLLRDAWRLYAGAPAALRVKQRLRVLVCPFEETIGFVPEGSTVLDVGCGSGLTLGLMAARGRRIDGHGFDPCPVAIGLANDMAAGIGDTGSTLSFEYRDARSRWRDRTYDVVHMQDVIHHVPAPSQRTVFDRACASVRRGGVFIYKDMSARPLWRNAACRLHDVVIAREWIKPVPIARVERWAEENGLSLEVSKTAHRAVYGNDLRVFRKRL
ncbi:class I SAM-dependent methyltransferase [Nonomuraea sp. NN258]|uniref:class I SAM-dependent methyltransferase n=1 Tax=Nonomuraea antri TaxID=2730852 RepID=UPI00156A2461|nr:class I SAM-dependent methyltransferase [Nonomuraea antri]NRQ34941.1 class I SAM-dependent methyltransferase [Nonomuraea antri]